jgi:hypothetical protein
MRHIRTLLYMVYCMQIIISAGRVKASNIVYGQEAIKLLGLAGYQGIGVPGVPSVPSVADIYSQKLVQLLNRDSDLGVLVPAKKLVYTCSGLLRKAQNKTTEMHVMLGHSHGQAQSGPKRMLMQLPKSNDEDPDPSYMWTSDTGVPLLHRWVLGPVHDYTHARLPVDKALLPSPLTIPLLTSACLDMQQPSRRHAQDLP